MTRIIRRCTLGMILTLLASSLAKGEEDEDGKLTAFFKQYLEDEFRQRPMAATRLGDHRFDHLLDDLSPSSREGWKMRNRQARHDLEDQIDSRKLSAPGKIDFAILKHHLDMIIWL